MKTQFRKIVIGIDFSDASLAGARWVATHLAPDAELLLVHVVPLPQPPAYLHGQLGSTIVQPSNPVPHLYTALQEFADLLGVRRVRVGIRTGVSWSALAKVAGEVKADLICVGRGHSRRGSSRFGATTPQRLLGITRIPVLVIPQGVVAKPSRVLVAVSAGQGGEGVIPVAGQIATAWRSSLEPIHVVETELGPVLRRSTRRAEITDLIGKRADERTTGIDALDEEAVRTLAAEWVASRISAAGSIDSHEPTIRIGDAGQEIITVAREKSGLSVIVMGRLAEALPFATSRGQYRCGSTTRMVLWAAPGPVLVVPLESVDDVALPFERGRGPGLRFPAHSFRRALPESPSPGGWHSNGDGAA
jgi:nucleotide-binding universal stress UspA family protein